MSLIQGSFPSFIMASDLYRIESYSFGKMLINGVEHLSDLVVSPNGVDASWWRKEGHRFSPEDLSNVDLDGIESVFIGTGQDGLMVVDPITKDLLTEKGIQFFIAKTAVAVDRFNDCEHSRKVGFFHLTC